MPRKPPSEKQLAANRANSARSTGPRTPDGKARSAQNARKHGFAASAFAVVRLEELDEVARLKDDLVTDYQPANSQECFAVERIALAQHALLRAARLEAGLFTACMDLALDSRDNPINPMAEELVGGGDIEIVRAQNRNFALATGFDRMAQRSNSWSLLLRYQSQAERQYRRAVEEFERLKSLREFGPEDSLACTAGLSPGSGADTGLLPRSENQDDPERSESNVADLPNEPISAVISQQDRRLQAAERTHHTPRTVGRRGPFVERWGLGAQPL